MLNREISVAQSLFLLKEMNGIQKVFKEMGTYPYELYTLMCAVALKSKINYNMDIHFKLMDIQID